MSGSMWFTVRAAEAARKLKDAATKAATKAATDAATKAATARY
jgi:hypothetical protein